MGAWLKQAYLSRWMSDGCVMETDIPQQIGPPPRAPCAGWEAGGHLLAGLVWRKNEGPEELCREELHRHAVRPCAWRALLPAAAAVLHDGVRVAEKLLQSNLNWKAQILLKLIASSHCIPLRNAKVLRTGRGEQLQVTLGKLAPGKQMNPTEWY
eukprot:1157841-Pelagomonas_calceolata.AAC.6